MKLYKFGQKVFGSETGYSDPYFIYSYCFWPDGSDDVVPVHDFTSVQAEKILETESRVEIEPNDGWYLIGESDCGFYVSAPDENGVYRAEFESVKQYVDRFLDALRDDYRDDISDTLVDGEPLKYLQLSFDDKIEELAGVMTTAFEDCLTDDEMSEIKSMVEDSYLVRKGISANKG